MQEQLGPKIVLQDEIYRQLHPLKLISYLSYQELVFDLLLLTLTSFECMSEDIRIRQNNLQSLPGKFLVLLMSIFP